MVDIAIKFEKDIFEKSADKVCYTRSTRGTLLMFLERIQTCSRGKIRTVVGEAKPKPSNPSTINQPTGASSGSGSSATGAGPPDDDESEWDAGTSTEEHASTARPARVSAPSTSDAGLSDSWAAVSANGYGAAQRRNASKYDAKSTTISNNHAATSTVSTSTTAEHLW